MQIKDIGEKKCIELICKQLEYPPFMKNRPNTSDSEIIDLGFGPYMAVTIDSIDDRSDLFPGITPYQIGWTAVNVSISDLAAVGARPMGMLLSWEVDRKTEVSKVEEMASGINAAARYHGAFVLGGDLNDSSKGLHFSACALGLVDRDRLMTRKGAHPGDILAVTGDVGGANAAVIALLKGLDLPQCKKDILFQKLYAPTARVKESGIISKYATSCIDLSDGLYAGLYELMRVNGVGVKLFNEEFYLQEAKEIMLQLGYPLGLLGAGGAGDYELLFTINEKDLPDLSSEFNKENMKITPIGQALHEERFLVETKDGLKERDLPFFEQFKFDLDDLEGYLGSLLNCRSL